MEFEHLKLDRLILLKTSERTERGEIVSLSRNIAKNGVLVPITVRKILHTDRFEVLSGVKRFYASRIARLKTIPSFIVDTPAGIARLIIKRGEKQDIFEEAEAIRCAILDNDVTAEELAEQTGYTEREVVALLRLTKMGEFEREIVRRNNIDPRSASEIAVIDDICKRTELLTETVKMRLQPAEVRSLCERARSGKRRPELLRSSRFNDMRIFDNTITRAVSLLKEAGVNADVCSEKQNGYTEYKIKIK